MEQGYGSRIRLPRLPPPGWRPSRGARTLAAVTLVIGLAAGFAAGYVQGRKTAPHRLAVTASPFPFSDPALTESEGTCSARSGPDLELGIPVTNQSLDGVLLSSARPVTPVAGVLRVLSWHWGPCGLDPGAPYDATVPLGPGQTVWITAAVRPLTACPGPAPLQFAVAYVLNGRRLTVHLPGFADLSPVRYSGCLGPVP